MELAARTAAWAKSGYTAKDYVTKNPVAIFDGIENAGYGVHDDTINMWGGDSSGNWRGRWHNLAKNKIGWYALWGNSNITKIYQDHIWGQANLRDASEIFSVLAGKSFSFEIVFLIPESLESIRNSIFLFNNSSGGGYLILIQDRILESGYIFIGDNRKNYVDRESKRGEMISYAVVYDGDLMKIYKNGILMLSESNTITYTDSFITSFMIDLDKFALRINEGVFTDKEIAANYAIDKARFNIPD